jgi:hypothetical protein
MRSGHCQRSPRPWDLGRRAGQPLSSHRFQLISTALPAGGDRDQPCVGGHGGTTCPFPTTCLSRLWLLYWVSTPTPRIPPGPGWTTRIPAGGTRHRRERLTWAAPRSKARAACPPRPPRQCPESASHLSIPRHLAQAARFSVANHVRSRGLLAGRRGSRRTRHAAWSFGTCPQRFAGSAW